MQHYSFCLNQGLKHIVVNKAYNQRRIHSDNSKTKFITLISKLTLDTVIVQCIQTHFTKQGDY